MEAAGGGYVGALSHDVIHGLDITIALGLDHVVPLEWMRMILAAGGPKQVRYFGVDLDGIRLRADDLDWSFGTGTDLTGRAQHLLMVLCGRRPSPGLVHGPAADRFTRAE
ncbi:hypothetical protein [Nocardia paucivorans]|uniref:hypothetical protein n=1 Tax=Nocardia paucivorans TaxID=114259 RepID=UPI0002D8CED6|nr:hypothetical protein [Nocardia paucivorans]